MTHKTKATGGGRQWENTKHKPEHHSGLLTGGQSVRFAPMTPGLTEGHYGEYADLLVGYSCSLTSPFCDVFQVCDPIFVRLYSLRNFSRTNAHGANLSCSCSLTAFLRCFFLDEDNFFNDLSVIVDTCNPVRHSSPHHGAGDGYSCSLALRRFSSAGANQSLYIRRGIFFSSLLHIRSLLTCSLLMQFPRRKTYKNREPNQYIFCCMSYSLSASLFFLRWRRLISPRMAVTINCASVSFSSFTKFISLKTSRGTLAVFCCDLLLVVPVGISVLLTVRWCSVYGEKKIKKDLKCKSPKSNLDFKVTCTKKQRPALLEQ